MRRILWGGTTWEIQWRRDAVEFSDRRGALLFLLQFKSDSHFMSDLRQLLIEGSRGRDLSRVSDQKVLEEVASLLASRQLWLKREYHVFEGGSAAENAEAQPEAQPLPPVPQQPAQPEPTDEPIFAPNIDAAAIAAVQREAAQTGTPFCEE